MWDNLKTVMLAAIFGLLVGISGILVAEWQKTPTQKELVQEYYRVENAVKVSPHGLRKLMDKGDKSFILVDLRSAQEYEKEHIAGAVSIPAYKDPDTSAYEETDRIIGEFKRLDQRKDIIVYCYSTACMTGRKVGLMLAEKGIFVKHLGIGWNEWRYQWTGWNHEHEWALTKPEDYIVSGKDPGMPVLKELPSPCGTGKFSC